MDELPDSKQLAERLRDTALRGFRSPDPGCAPTGPGIRTDISWLECPAPSVMSLALSLAGIKLSGRMEKVAWWATFIHDGAYYEVSHQKFGLRLIIAKSSFTEQEAHARAERTKKKLLAATRMVEKSINAAAPTIVEAGNATVLNQHYRLDLAYQYFRERAMNPHIIDDDRPVVSFDESGTRAISRTFGEEQMRLHATHDAVACITAYLSRLEHDLVLSLPFAGFDPRHDHLTRFIGQRWGLKYERILGTSTEAKTWSNRLSSIIERWRNPYAHGGFEKGNGSTVYAHIPGAGALPIGLSGVRSRPSLSLTSADALSIEDILTVFDDFDAWFAATVPHAHAWINSGLSVRFDEDFRDTLQQLSGDQAGFEDFLSFSIETEDRNWNMDF